ncbi:hypothetical protein BOX15_Mlig032395g1 [Macrostomum lignano]|uniref:Uncharacterized protein n=1 Tax=Macrostomum lignano TaxID=282301 RepID=A0A267E3G4_9PLAT|nr:hypothetical protein BOX15_Mlig032395g1 [Macrostomum lignano]
MSLKLFEQFLQMEIARRPGLANALKWKGGLRLCSQLFDEAVADLHYRLIRRAVQLLFSRANAARLRELACDTSGAQGGFGDGAVGSSCETKYASSESSRTATPGRSRCTSRSGDAGTERWDGQSNNSQSLKQTPRSTARYGGGLGCYGNGGSTGNNSRWPRASDVRQTPQQQWQPQQQPQQQHQCQQPQQPQFCQQQQQQPPVPERGAAVCSGPVPQPCKPPTPLRPQAAGQQAAKVREGPAYNYPSAGSHNRQAMAGWYVANMDALLSNLMRLFEKIYADTLSMCGASPSAVKELRNALPDPTLLSMQQRVGGAWRPNYMTCKIDFVLHMAAMVYRNTQDLRCGCRCPEPADPCPALGDQPRQTQQQQQLDCLQQAALTRHSGVQHTVNRNNAAAAAVVTADELEDDNRGDTGDTGDWRSPRLAGQASGALQEDSSWERPPVLNANGSSSAGRRLQGGRQTQKTRRSTTPQPLRRQKPQQSVETKYFARAFVDSKDARTGSSAVSTARARPKRRHRRSCPKQQKKQPLQPAVRVQRTFRVSEDGGCSGSERTQSTSPSSTGSDSRGSAAGGTHFRCSIDVPR